MRMRVRRKAGVYEGVGNNSTNPQGGSGSQSAPNGPLADAGKKMVIRPEGENNGLIVPYAPREVSFDNMADSYAQVVRMGQDPLVVKDAEGVKGMSFTLFIGTKAGVASVVDIIEKLERYANSGKPLYVNYSSMEAGKWQLSSMDVRTTMRRPSDHEVVQAEVDVTFVLSTGGVDGLGPVTGGVKSGGKGSSGKTVIHEVKKGESLHDIAIHFFKDASRWKDIAKWNDLKSAAKKDLKPGQKLKIKLPEKKGGK